MDLFQINREFRNIAARKCTDNYRAMDILREIEGEIQEVKALPDFKAGDTISVHYRITEGSKERVQQFQGIVLQRSGSGINGTFTVRKMSGNTGVERIFPIASPFIDKIEVHKRGVVRRARIFYLRERTGKSARIKERRIAKDKK